jgi:hypothetical protein
MKTVIKDAVNMNEAMTRQITLDKSENRTIHVLICQRKISEHSNRICVMLVEGERMNYRRSIK